MVAMINLESQYSVHVNCLYFLSKLILSPCMTTPTKRHVCPAKTQISICIRPGWLESSPCAQWTQPFFMRTVKTLIRLDYAQADRSLRWARMSFCCLYHEAAYLVLQMHSSTATTRCDNPGVTMHLVGRRIRMSMVCTNLHKACFPFTTPEKICLYQYILAWKYC